MLEVFGDESCGSKFVVYGLFATPSDMREEAEAILRQTKNAFGGSEAMNLHCRILFSGDARRKSPWKFLSVGDVARMYETLAADISKLNTRRIVCVARKSDFPDALPSLELEHVDSRMNIPSHVVKGFDIGEKHLAAWCAQGATIPLAKSPGFEKVRFWPDTDHSKVEWFGKKRKFTNTIPSFVDLGSNCSPLLTVQKGNQKPALTEVADLVAYITQRYLTERHGSRNAHRVKKIYEAMSPEVVRFEVNPEGHFGFRVPS